MTVSSEHGTWGHAPREGARGFAQGPGATRASPVIGLDWGSSRLRAYRIDAGGRVLERRAGDHGAIGLSGGEFDAVLVRTVGDWAAADGAARLIACGMVGARGGWAEAPYVDLPAGVSAIRERVVEVPTSLGRPLAIVGGLRTGEPDVLRGEETQALGCGVTDAVLCMPGTHSKWLRIRAGTVESFATWLTGELFELLGAHGSLAKAFGAPRAPVARRPRLDWRASTRRPSRPGCSPPANPTGSTSCSCFARGSSGRAHPAHSSARACRGGCWAANCARRFGGSRTPAATHRSCSWPSRGWPRCTGARWRSWSTVAAMPGTSSAPTPTAPRAGCTGSPMASEAPRRGSAQQPFDVSSSAAASTARASRATSAGRGLSVLLCENDDLAAHTSASSTKLIHGGLRYLEYYEFGLVRKSLQSARCCCGRRPHIIWPLRFVMPHDASMRPQWMIRAGLFLYDHLARRELLPASQAVDLRRHPAGEPLRGFGRGFIYSDGWVDDARLVVLNALDAHERGAAVLTRWRSASMRRRGADAGRLRDCTAPTRRDARTSTRVRWSTRPARGRPSSWPARSAASARRCATSRAATSSCLRCSRTVRVHLPEPGQADHLCDSVRGPLHADRHHRRGIRRQPGAGRDRRERDRLPVRERLPLLRHPVGPSDVVWSYSGVRPLLDDDSGPASAVTRDYSVELDVDGAPLLTVFGGKITTYRKLAEEAVDRLLGPLAARAPAWTAGSGRGGPPHLPGGDMPDADFERFATELAARVRWMPPVTVRRLARGYGTRVSRVLGDARAAGDLGREVAPGLHEAELAYLMEHEWACDAQDVLWRRTKLGLHLSADERRSVADWFEALARPSPRAPEPART